MQSSSDCHLMILHSFVPRRLSSLEPSLYLNSYTNLSLVSLHFFSIKEIGSQTIVDIMNREKVKWSSTLWTTTGEFHNLSYWYSFNFSIICGFKWISVSRIRIFRSSRHFNRHLNCLLHSRDLADYLDFDGLFNRLIPLVLTFQPLSAFCMQ